MNKRLENKVAIVTGAGSVGSGWGNGKAASVVYARHGAKVFAVDINLEAAQETKSIIESEGGVCEIARVDVTKSKDITAMVEQCVNKFGRVDILHNNVGIALVGGPTDIDEATWDRVMSINLKSVFLSCRAVLPIMEKQSGGVITNISSIAAIRYTGVPYTTYYTSKAAILGFTRGIALQYAPKNIRANCILPGLLNTPMIVEPLKGVYGGGDVEKMIEVRNKQCPTGAMGDAWDVANAALFLASDEAGYITGTDLVVDGGITSKIV